MDQLVKFLGSLQSYFNDFIGAVAPAIVFLLCVPVVSGIELPIYDGAQWGGFAAVFAVVCLFALGHVLIAISELVRKIMRKLKIGPKEWLMDSPIDHTKDAAGAEFVRLLQAKGLSETANLQSNVIRNIAMTVSDDGRELGRRFMFLALFCYGSATALFVSATAGLGTSLFNAIVDWSTAQFDWRRAVAIALAIGGWWLLLGRGVGFERRAGYAPVSTALAELLVAPSKAKAKTKDDQRDAPENARS